MQVVVFSASLHGDFGQLLAVPVATLICHFRCGILAFAQRQMPVDVRCREGFVVDFHIHCLGLVLFVYGLQKESGAVVEVVDGNGEFAFFVELGVIHGIAFGVISH